MKSSTNSTETKNKINLHLFWGPNEAIATWDFPRLNTASATVSDELLDWMREGAATGLNPARVDFLVESVVSQMIRCGWNPHVPHRSFQPLRLGLLSQGTVIEVCVRAQRSGEHLLRLEIADGARN